jgi:Fe-S cluster assembly protein SufD
MMIAEAAEQQSAYLSEFARFARETDGGSWIHQIRRDAMAAFAELGFPTTHREDWKYTNVAPIARGFFELAGDRTAPALSGELERLALGDSTCHRLVFVNGHFHPELSSPEPAPKGVTVTSLARALCSQRAAEDHLTRYANYKSHSFVALNTAFLEDGAFVQVPRGVVVEKPIHFVFLAAPGRHPAVSHPRNLVVAGAGSQLTVMETYIGQGAYFTNPVTEIAAGENSTIRHLKAQLEGEQAFHIGTVQVEQERDARFSSHFISLGGALVRNETNVVLSEGAESTLNGFYMAEGTQHIDNQIFVDHAKPHGTSHELYKGILDGKSSAVFNGRILVRKDAQKTDAKQTNKNLVLSEDATINTKPELQIYADDVKCTHGATIGQIDAEAVFYLRSRGIGPEEARRLLTYAFAREVIDRIKVESVRVPLEAIILERLARKEAL